MKSITAHEMANLLDMLPRYVDHVASASAEGTLSLLSRFFGAYRTCLAGAGGSAIESGIAVGQNLARLIATGSLLLPKPSRKQAQKTHLSGSAQTACSRSDVSSVLVSC